MVNQGLAPIGEIHGAYQLQTTPFSDERGWFRDTIRVPSLPPIVAGNFSPQQVSVSNSADRVVRGIHFSVTELDGAYFQTVTCAEGEVMDVLVDLRRGSPTFRGVFSTVLSPQSGLTMLMPPGVGHGFKVLKAPALIVYTMSRAFPSAQTRVIRPDYPPARLWEDHAMDVVSMSDRTAPPLDDAERQGFLPVWQP